MLKCADCGNEIRKELNQTPYETAHGILCQKCFSKRWGKEIEKYPIGFSHEVLEENK